MESAERSLNERERRGLGTPGSNVPRREAYRGTVEEVVNVNAAIPVQGKMQRKCHSNLEEDDTTY